LQYDEAGHSAYFITPEDIVVAKLIAYQNTESDKHLRDAQSVLMMQGSDLNIEHIYRSSRASGVLELFEKLLLAAKEKIEAG
jgi:hypothetical protein